MKRNLIDEGNIPEYKTKNGKLLFADESKYDDYSSVANVKILCDIEGRFWGYSDSEKIEEV